jgi:hypothetical protein
MVMGVVSYCCGRGRGLRRGVPAGHVVFRGLRWDLVDAVWCARGLGGWARLVQRVVYLDPPLPVGVALFAHDHGHGHDLRGWTQVVHVVCWGRRAVLRRFWVEDL